MATLKFTSATDYTKLATTSSGEVTTTAADTNRKKISNVDVDSTKYDTIDANLRSQLKTDLGNIKDDLSTLNTNKQETSTAVTHTKNTAVGSGTKGVYVNASGVATEMTYKVESDVPENAKFTDTEAFGEIDITNGDKTTTLSADTVKDKFGITAGNDVTLTVSGDTITVASTDQSVTSVDNHYSPTKNADSTKSASGATATDIANSSTGVQIVTGIEMDAKGHVTGVVSGAVTATNTTYSDATTSAKGLVQVGTNINVSSGVISVKNGTTSAKGVVTLATTSADSTSETLATTPKYVSEKIKSAVSGLFHFVGTVSAKTELDKLTATGAKYTLSSNAITASDSGTSTLAVGDVFNVWNSSSSGDTDGMNYVWTGSAWDAMGATFSYTLPVATTSVLGGVKDGDRVTIDSNGFISADLATTAGVAGAVSAGDGLQVAEAGVMSAKAYNGIVVNSNGISTNIDNATIKENTDGAMYARTATTSDLGVVKAAANSGISISSGAISANVDGSTITKNTTTGVMSVPTASTTSSDSALGLVKIATNSSISNTSGAIDVEVDDATIKKGTSGALYARTASTSLGVVSVAASSSISVSSGAIDVELAASGGLQKDATTGAISVTDDVVRTSDNVYTAEWNPSSTGSDTGTLTLTKIS